MRVVYVLDKLLDVNGSGLERLQLEPYVVIRDCGSYMPLLEVRIDYVECNAVCNSWQITDSCIAFQCYSKECRARKGKGVHQLRTK